MLPMCKLVWSNLTTKCLSTKRNILNCPNRLIKKWTAKFVKSGVPEPELSAKYIISHVVNQGDERVLADHNLARVEKLCQERLKRVPVQYIIEEWDFRTVNLKLRPPILIPRPETEDLVGYILDHLENDNLGSVGSVDRETFLEIGCGSGAISISLLKEFKQVNGVAIDILPEAVQLTKENSVHNEVQSRLLTFAMSIEDCVSQLKMKFDHLISNPPYVKTMDIINLQPEITRYESHIALDGGEDGLQIIHHILEIASNLMKPNGYLWLESGLDHDLKNLVSSNPQWQLLYLAHLPDFTGRLRFHKLIRNNNNTVNKTLVTTCTIEE